MRNIQTHISDQMNALYADRLHDGHLGRIIGILKGLSSQTLGQDSFFRGKPMYDIYPSDDVFRIEPNNDLARLSPIGFPIDFSVAVARRDGFFQQRVSHKNAPSDGCIPMNKGNVLIEVLGLHEAVRILVVDKGEVVVIGGRAASDSLTCLAKSVADEALHVACMEKKDVQTRPYVPNFS